jgi:thioredoxin:protein disulfide reductase
MFPLSKLSLGICPNNFLNCLYMTESEIALSSLLLLLSMLPGCSKTTTNQAEPAASPTVEGKRIASVDVVKATPGPLEISVGRSGEAIVRLTIQSGYHINANPPTYSYLKATELEIAPADGVAVVSVTYPKPLERTFAFAEKPLAVYEGDTELKATLKADKSAKQGERSISARLRIQACDDQVCYPPGTMDLAIPVTIK